MPSDRLSILYNPSAGMGRALGRKIKLERLLRHFEIRYDLVMTRSEEHLRELTRAHARSYPAVVGAGGDSTFHIMIGEMTAAGGGAGGKARQPADQRNAARASQKKIRRLMGPLPLR